MFLKGSIIRLHHPLAIIAILIAYSMQALAVQTREETNVSNCWALLQSTPPLLKKTEIDPIKLQKWLDAYKDDQDVLETVKWLVTNIEIVSLQKVQENVIRAFQQFLDGNEDRPIAFVVHEDSRESKDHNNRSGAWLTGLIMDKFLNLRKAQVFSFKNEASIPRIKKFFESNPNANFVIVDDIGYSGIQLWSLAQKIHQHIDKNPLRTNVITSALSLRARKELQRYAQMYYIDDVPLAEDAFAKLPLNRQLKMKPILEKISRAYQNDILRQTLTTVDYKMVDEYSFPYFLAAGAVLKWTGDYVEEGENMPFINAGVPPYKLLPYLDPAEVNSLKAP